MKTILLAETPELLSPSPSRDDISRSLEAARLTGWKIISIPPISRSVKRRKMRSGNSKSNLSLLPFVGLDIPDLVRYKSLYKAAAAKNAWLINSPEQHHIAQEFDKAYPFLEELTPRSVFADSVESALELAPQIGFPIFVKGAVQSRKARGWKACVADNEWN